MHGEKKIRYSALISSIVLYTSHLWGLSYNDTIEQVQTYFYKRLLGVSCFVPNHVIRLEVGVPKIEVKMLKQALMYWIRLMLMDDSRYAKKCFIALRKNADQTDCIKKYNWAASMKEYFACTGFNFLWNECNVAMVMSHAYNMIEKLWEMRRQEDIARVRESSRYNYYLQIMNESPLCAKYLSFDLDYIKVKMLAQARISRVMIEHENFKHEFSFERCVLCHACDDESMIRFMFSCPGLNDLNSNQYRNSTLNKSLNWQEEQIVQNLYIIFQSVFGGEENYCRS